MKLFISLLFPIVFSNLAFAQLQGPVRLVSDPYEVLLDLSAIQSGIHQNTISVIKEHYRATLPQSLNFDLDYDFASIVSLAKESALLTRIPQSMVILYRNIEGSCVADVIYQRMNSECKNPNR